MSKALYLPSLTLLFTTLIRQGTSHEEITRYIELSSYIIIIMLLLPITMQLQIYTYGDYAYGIKGFFQPGNDIGLALGLAIFSSGYRLVYIKFNIFRLFLIFLAMYSLILLGSRASLILLAGFGLTMFTSSLLFNTKGQSTTFKDKKFKPIVSFCIFILVIGSLTHGYLIQQTYNYQKEKINALTNGELPRQDLVQKGFIYLDSRSDIFNIFGEGSVRYMQSIARGNPNEYYSTIEVDWIDSYGSYGVLFTFVIYCFLFIVLLFSIKIIVASHLPLILFSSAALFLYISHSILAGHAIFSPTPSTFAAAYIAFIINSTPNSLRRYF
jgi:hypothetical protein